MTPDRRRRPLVLGAAALAAALLAALLVWSPWSGSGGSDAARRGSGARGGTSSTAPAGGAATTTSVAGVEGGTVRLGLAGHVVVDPPYANAASPSDLMVLDLLYDGLARMDGPGPSASAIPALAASWEPDPSLRSWRFRLDPDARFASGRPVLAADVVASLEHVIAGGDASPAALRLEAVQGFRAYLDRAAPAVSGLRRIDDRTVDIVLDAPMAQLPTLLAAPPYGIVDVVGLAQLAPDGPLEQLERLDTTGAWQVVSASDGALRLARRADRPGHLDAVELRPHADVEAAYRALEHGEVDWAPVPGARYGEAVRRFGSGAFAPFQAELLLGMRLDHPALARPELRQAVAAALDRRALVKAVYPDEALPLAGVVPGGVGEGADAAPAHDPARARQLLQAAYPDGEVPRIELDFDASPATQALMALVAESLGEVGIPTTSKPMALDDYQRLLATGQPQLFVLSWLGVSRSPDAYLDPLFRSTSADNLLALRDPGIDAALDAARSTLDPAVAAARWRDVEQTVLSTAIVAPIAQFRTQVAVSPRVLGLRHDVDGSVDWSAVQLAAPR